MGFARRGAVCSRPLSTSSTTMAPRGSPTPSPLALVLALLPSSYSILNVHTRTRLGLAYAG